MTLLSSLSAMAKDPFRKLRTLAKRRDQTDQAFRTEIVRLVDEEGYSLRAVAGAAGITNPAIHYIVRKARTS